MSKFNHLFQRTLVIIAFIPFIYCGKVTVLTAMTKLWPTVPAEVQSVSDTFADQGVIYQYEYNGFTHKANTVNLYGLLSHNRLWDQLIDYRRGKTVTARVNPFWPKQAVLETDFSGAAVVGLAASAWILSNRVPYIADLIPQFIYDARLAEKNKTTAV